ncbi:MAG: DUF4160 domain-containing protein [Candidatus Rokubacteria bacterium]|nr:DUF4160 domain-containing protein [Candidatus Rokubacteria bacterium]
MFRRPWTRPWGTRGPCCSSSRWRSTLPGSFRAGDRDEPPHVHVEREDSTAKFWLDPVRVQRSGGFGGVELQRIQRLVRLRREQLLRCRDEYFHD